jgi:hypothetical protein
MTSSYIFLQRRKSETELQAPNGHYTGSHTNLFQPTRRMGLIIAFMIIATVIIQP